MDKHEIEIRKAVRAKALDEILDILGTFVSWTAGSACSPISQNEATQLLKRIKKTKGSLAKVIGDTEKEND